MRDAATHVRQLTVCVPCARADVDLLSGTQPQGGKRRELCPLTSDVCVS